MSRVGENRVVFGMAVAAVVLFAVFLVVGRGGSGPVSLGVAPTATPVVSEQAQAEAVALLGAASQQRAAGQLGAALASSDQALGKWPQYDAAQRFVLTVVPQATAVQQATEAKATAAAQAVLVQAQAGANARRVYSTKAALSLQRYADALGNLYQKNREARDQPALVVDTTWRFRSAAALATMQDAAGTLTDLGPVPQDMAASVDLFSQIATETTQLSDDYALGMNDPATQTVPFAATRLDHASDLLRQANVEVRRAVPSAA
jgi:hypothetical protein